jgi:putative NADPH-quinone reductase
MKALVAYARSDPDGNRHNAALVAAAGAVPGVTVHDLARACPDFGVDADREAELLHAHDQVVLQFPMHRYSVPAIAERWLGDGVRPSG